MSGPSQTAPYGWECVSCGVFVPHGVWHSCWASESNAPYPPPLQSTPGELRIAAALERIAVALERLAASGEVRP